MQIMHFSSFSVSEVLIVSLCDRVLFAGCSLYHKKGFLQLRIGVFSAFLLI